MMDFLVIGLGVVLFWIVGLALLLLLRAPERLLKTAPVFGAAVMLLITFPLYYFNVPIPMVQCVLAALSAAAAALLLRRRPKGQWKWLAGLLALYTLLAIPLFIGGEQYYVFRGNEYDHFFYISESLTAYFFPIRQVRALTQAEAARAFGTWVATGQRGLLSDRPAVATFFACFLTPGFGDVVARAAMFNTACIALLWLPVQYLWDAVLTELPVRRFRRAVRFLPPFAYAVGFFSQFSFDTNAWSQMTSMPILLLLFSLYGERLGHVLQPGEELSCSKEKPFFRGLDPAWILLTLLALSGCALYVEGYLSYCAALFVISVAGWLWSRFRKRRIRVREALLLPVVMTGSVLLAFLPAWKTSVSFMTAQLKNATGSLSYADYYYRYWQGRTFTDSVRAVLNRLPSVLGFYYLTPDYEEASGALARNLMSGGMLLLNLLIIAGLVGAVVCVIRNRRFFSSYLTGGALTAFGAFVLLLLAGQTWTAGKYLQYLSPCVFLLLCLGLAGAGQAPVKRTGRVLASAAALFAALTVVCNIGFGAARILRANESVGVGYVSTYPSILDWTSKTRYRWEVDTAPLRACETVEVSTDLDSTGFYSNWLFFKAVYNRQRPYTAAELIMNFGDATSFGHMDATACDGYLRAEDPDGDGVFEAAAGVVH